MADRTQTLNTRFEADASPMIAELGKMSGAIGALFGSVFDRAQNVQNVARTTGMSPESVQAAQRMEESTGVKGLAGAVAEMNKNINLGAGGGIFSALKMMGIDKDKFVKANAEDQIVMASTGLAGISDFRRRDLAAQLLGDENVWMAVGGQAKAFPSAHEKMAAVAAATATSAENIRAQEESGMQVRTAKGAVVDTLQTVRGGGIGMKQLDLVDKVEQTIKGWSGPNPTLQSWIGAKPVHERVGLEAMGLQQHSEFLGPKSGYQHIVHWLKKIAGNTE